MTTLNDFKQLRASVPAEVQKELYSLFASDPDAARQRIVELAAEQGVTLTVEQVRQFLRQMDEEEEFNDIDLMPWLWLLWLVGRRCECHAADQ